MLKFIEEGHIYESTDGENIDWLSVTSLVKYFAQPFNGLETAKKCAKSKKSKWYGLTPDEILAEWKRISDEAINRGNWYHKMMETTVLACDTIRIQDNDCVISRPMEENGIKYSPNQKLENNTIYPEHFVYLKSAGICGQSDRVQVVNGFVDIIDFKTNAELKTEGYTNWEGITTMMKGPVSHLQDCHLSHYNLQLSIYMYIILRHNPKLKAGKLVIHHIVFEEEGRDKYDKAITKLDSQGNPIIKEVIPYELPYLKEEVISVLNYIKLNKVKKHVA